MAKCGRARIKSVSRTSPFAAMLGVLLAIGSPALAESVSFPSLDGAVTGSRARAAQSFEPWSRSRSLEGVAFISTFAARKASTRTSSRA